MKILQTLFRDESGMILSAELILIATIVVIASIVGLASVSHAIQYELMDVADAFGSMGGWYEMTSISMTTGATGMALSRPSSASSRAYYALSWPRRTLTSR